ncbi:sulfite exporter TauE/SafE family protein [Caproiciproducens sp.]
MNDKIMIYVMLAAIVLINMIFIVRFVLDFIKHKKETFQEKGSNLFYIILGFITMICATFGVSDYAINTVVYHKTGYVEDRLIPPTLNTECTIPLMFMALIYIQSIECDIITLIVLIIAQMIGSALSPRIVAKLPASTIRWSMGIGLGIAAVLVFLGQINVLATDGNLTALTGWRLAVAAVALFIYGAINNIGIGAYAPTMATIYALGMSPLVAFPIMMSACTVSIAVGSAEFVRLNNYARKPTFWFAIFGSIGVFCAAYLIKSLNVYAIKWIVMVVILFASYSLISKELQSLKKNAA